MSVSVCARARPERHCATACPGARPTSASARCGHRAPRFHQSAPTRWRSAGLHGDRGALGASRVTSVSIVQSRSRLKLRWTSTKAGNSVALSSASAFAPVCEGATRASELKRAGEESPLVHAADDPAAGLHIDGLRRLREHELQRLRRSQRAMQPDLVRAGLQRNPEAAVRFAADGKRTAAIDADVGDLPAIAGVGNGERHGGERAGLQAHTQAVAVSAYFGVQQLGAGRRAGGWRRQSRLQLFEQHRIRVHAASVARGDIRASVHTAATSSTMPVAVPGAAITGLVASPVAGPRRLPPVP